MSTVAAPMPPASRVREFIGAVATIMIKELRSRMRGRRAFIVLTIYLAVLAAITYAIYLMTYSAVANFGGFGMPNVNASASIGQAIFTGLSLLQILLVSFIAPAFTAGSISLEREKQTLDLLVSTPLRPGAIVVGKLLAALAFVFLMVLASVPLTAIVLMYGGAGVDDLLRQLLVLFVAAIGFGSIGLFFSALLKRTQMATVLTYATMLVLTLGTVFLYVFWTVMIASNAPSELAGPRARRAPEAILYLNPFVGMADVIANTEPAGSGMFGIGLEQIRGIDRFGGAVNGGNVVCEGGVCTDVAIGRPVPCPPGAPCPPPNFAPGPAPAAARQPQTGYFWSRFLVSFAVLSLLLTLLSMRLVVPAGMRFAFRRRSHRAAARPTGVPRDAAGSIEEIGP